ncbi:ABC transporter permease [Paenibacillus koleovorans]|uniref:ABC transporter permease n=1 Tax=Paenibacillus koleovorans TaxID=121608 RepID=UPI000FDB4735|nr:ABC transporter permease [Paenibacillus koleovorans]
MKAYIQLTLAQLRLFGRNRQVLFWTLLFPVFFMVMLGSFMGKNGGVSLSGIVIDEDRTTASAELMHTLMSQDHLIDFESADNRTDALKALKEGDVQIVAIIRHGYDASLQQHIGPGKGSASSEAAAMVEAHYDETNMTMSQLALTLLSEEVDAVSKKLANYKPVVAVEAFAVESLHLEYIDFLVPGILAMMIMSNNLNGVAGQIASWRERGILRRMQSTTLRSGTFIAAQITARLVMNSLQALIVLVIGSLFFGTQVNGSWLLLFLFVVLGTLTFMSIGFIIAGLAKTPESAGPIAGFISFPMLFVGGVFFPIKNMPEIVQVIVKLLPIAHLSTALRQVMNVGAGIGDLWNEALLLSVWMVAAFLISTFTFKWE